MTSEEKVILLEQKLKALQMYYAAALADSVLRYGNAGVLNRVAEQKRAEQMKTGAVLAERFGVREPKQAFTKIQEIYGCANWVCEDAADGFNAVCTNCTLCAISKKMGAYSPCQVHCLSPIEAMLKGVAPGAEFYADETLWDGAKCLVRVVLPEHFLKLNQTNITPTH